MATAESRGACVVGWPGGGREIGAGFPRVNRRAFFCVVRHCSTALEEFACTRGSAAASNV